MSYLETGDEKEAPKTNRIKPDTMGCSPIEIKELLSENLKLSQEMYSMLKGIKRYVLWQQVWAVFKILIIVIPLVLGFIYLPSILQPLLEQYKELMEGINSAEALSGLIK